MEGAEQGRERPKRFARNRLARCAVRHAIPQGAGLPGGQTQKYINDLERLIRQWIRSNL